MIELPICKFGNSLDENWNTCVRFLQADDELPIPDSLENLYLDFETTSERYNVASINPHAESLDGNLNLHRDCKICGVAFLFDNEKTPYYIPVRHAYIDENEKYNYQSGPLQNYNPEKVYDWLRKITTLAKKWINHNIKYDVHVLYNETGYYPTCKLECSIILSKLAQFEEKFEYGLTTMMREVGIDITPYEEKIKVFLGKKYKDYGLMPPDQMATYAAVDVLSVRHLVRILRTKISPSCQRVEDLEMNLLPMLIQIEQVGCKVDIDKLFYDWQMIVKLQLKRTRRVKKYGDSPDFIISGKGTKASHKELFVDKLGWDLDYTDTTNIKIAKGLDIEPAFSFGYDSIRKNASKNPRLAASYLSYQGDQKLLTSYVQPILESHVSSNRLIHCNINQQVRTGRMSVTNPGMQTLPPKAKFYIIPYTEDYSLVEFDLSQIEFRIIIHYINNRAAISAYKSDPSTDFHRWIAEMCKLERKPAKTCNFLLGYGGGKKHFLQVLSAYLMQKGGFTSESEVLNRANDVYKSYHTTLPELKPTSYRAGDVVKARGYTRTLLGRERHINRDFFYKAFNSVCQGSAADLQKDITLRLKKFIGIDCLLHLMVHDSWLFSIRKDRLNQLIPEIKYEIERPIIDVDFQVPLLCEFKVSAKNWGCMK